MAVDRRAESGDPRAEIGHAALYLSRRRAHERRQLQPFMKGPAYISIRARVPLVPMALIGTYELLPIHAHHFRPRPVKLVIGKPIDPSGYTIRQTDELTARLRTEILQLYDSHAMQPGDASDLSCVAR